MIPFLLSLLTIAILGGLVYIYLRKEQNKVIPKDKYDEAWNDFYKNMKPSFPTLKASILRNNFFIFLFVFCLVPIFTGLFIGIAYGYSIMDTIKFGSGFLSFSLTSLFIFPAGLGNLITLGYGGKNYVIIGWIPYIVIFLFRIFAKNRRALTFIKLAFIMLLIMNIAGCASMTPEFLRLLFGNAN